MSEVLVIDDSPTVLHYAEMILSEQGYLVHAVESAELGLIALTQFKPAAVFIDYVLPKMNGVSFCEVVRQSDMLPEVPLILMSSKPENELLALQHEISGLSFLSKPFEPEELLQVLEQALAV